MPGGQSLTEQNSPGFQRPDPLERHNVGPSNGPRRVFPEEHMLFYQCRRKVE